MTPMKDVVTLSADTVLDTQAVDKMFVLSLFFFFGSANLGLSLLSGYSRFPVHEPGNPTAFLGLLLVKKVGFFSFL